jgi:glycosyltransferase involved in cell wall biosynthesis
MRERLHGISTEKSMSLFVANAFAGFTRACAMAVFYAVDLVTPCCNVQNVEWEIHLGGKKVGNSRFTAAITRKIFPILNGMNLSVFKPHFELEDRERPTAIMLSHVNKMKDIENAIFAADYIVHTVGLEEFWMPIYGSLEHDPAYARYCQSLIFSLNLAQNVALMGFGAAAKVLPKAWVFLNSSMTEGLPLAIGEAGLAGMLLLIIIIFFRYLFVCLFFLVSSFIYFVSKHCTYDCYHSSL